MSVKEQIEELEGLKSIVEFVQYPNIISSGRRYSIKNTEGTPRMGSELQEIGYIKEGTEYGLPIPEDIETENIKVKVLKQTKIIDPSCTNGICDLAQHQRLGD